MHYDKYRSVTNSQKIYRLFRIHNRICSTNNGRETKFENAVTPKNNHYWSQTQDYNIPRRKIKLRMRLQNSDNLQYKNGTYFSNGKLRDDECNSD